VLRVVRHELAAELERVLPGRVREFVHEAFEVDRVLVEVHASPEAGVTAGLRMAWSIRTFGIV
jgi:hypothetical protein